MNGIVIKATTFIHWNNVCDFITFFSNQTLEHDLVQISACSSVDPLCTLNHKYHSCIVDMVQCIFSPKGFKMYSTIICRILSPNRASSLQMSGEIESGIQTAKLQEKTVHIKVCKKVRSHPGNSRNTSTAVRRDQKREICTQAGTEL